MKNSEDTKLLAVHVCAFCGTTVERAQVQAEDLLTGLVCCPKCGKESPLDIAIVDPSKKRPSKGVKKAGQA